MMCNTAKVFLVVATTANMHDEIVMYSAMCTRGGGGSSANVGEVVYTLVLVHICIWWRYLMFVCLTQVACMHWKHIILLEKSKGLHMHMRQTCVHMIICNHWILCHTHLAH